MLKKNYQIHNIKNYKSWIEHLKMDVIYKFIVKIYILKKKINILKIKL